MVVNHSGRSYLVTGAGSGIGRACAIQLADSGARVYINDLTSEACEQTRGEIVSKGGTAHIVVGDVASPMGWHHEVHELGPLHGIVHNAGFDLPTPMDLAPRADYERLIAVMFTGPLELTQRLVPVLEAAKGACVLFIASVHALATEPGVGGYAACKAAQIAVVRAMAQDLGSRSIRALTVSPGYIDTPLLAKLFDGEPDPKSARDHAASLHPLGRIGRPEDVATAVSFLLSPVAEFINGVNVVIDGGLTANLYR